MRRWSLLVIGPLISIVALVMILRRIDFAHFVEALSEIQPFWLAPIIPLYVIAISIRGVRWQLMLYPVKAVRWRVTTSVIFLGLMANNLLPARLGELVRAFALSSREQLGTAFSLASIAAERIFDGLALLVIFWVTATLTQFPAQLEETLSRVAWAVGSVFLLAFAFVLTARLAPGFVERLVSRATAWLPERVSTRSLELLRSALRALAFLRADRRMLFFVLLTLAVWLVEGVVLWLATLAFGIDPDLRLAYFTLVLIGFSVAVPSAPGYVGVFEAGVVLAFAAFGIGREVALSYAVVVHGLQFAVIGAGGLISLHALGLSFGSLRRMARAEELGS